MTKIIPFVLFSILAACGKDSDKDPNTLTLNLSHDCRLHEQSGTTALPYVAIGAGMLARPQASTCRASKSCPPQLPSAECDLRPSADIQILAVTPDGLVGRVRDEGAPANACADRTVVWLPRDGFVHKDTFGLGASMFPTHCSTRPAR